jgi:hypothetical protein
MDHERATAGDIIVGQVFSDAMPPRRQWRVSEAKEGSFTLECIGRPSILRFLDAKALHDETRYRRLAGAEPH